MAPMAKSEAGTAGDGLGCRYESAMVDGAAMEDVMRLARQAGEQDGGAGRFAYGSRRERDLLLQALSQMPPQLALARSVDDLGRPTLEQGPERIIWHFATTPGMDPAMNRIACGHYMVSYAPGDGTWGVGLRWEARTHQGMTPVDASAGGFWSLPELIGFLRIARSVGTKWWIGERARILPAVTRRRLRDDARIREILAGLAADAS